MENCNLKEEEIDVIKNFQEKINNSKIGKENEIYLKSFIDAFLSNNFIASANTGFIFLEKYLRTKLVFFENQIQKIPNDDFLTSLDSIEKMLEDGEGTNSVSSSFDNLRTKLQQFGHNSEISKKEIENDLVKYFKIVKEKGGFPKYGYQFVDICKKLEKYEKIDNNLKKELLKLYRKYRNPIQHGLFKRLIDSIDGETIKVYCGGTPNSGIKEVQSSNMLLREIRDNLTPISKDISIEILCLISKTIDTLGDFNNKNKQGKQ